jgi:hypothetical protein
MKDGTTRVPAQTMDLKSCPPDQELGALLKELASQILFHPYSILPNQIKEIFHKFTVVIRAL